jgi:hypothetical protein
MKSLFQMAAHGLRACASEMATMALMVPVQVITQVSEQLAASRRHAGQAKQRPVQDEAQAALVLQSTGVKMHCLGAIANVVVTRHYRNESSAALTARYVCSASAGLYGMKLRLGNRVLRTRIQVRSNPGSEAAQRMALRVREIGPGQELSLELRYTHLLCAAPGRHQN